METIKYLFDLFIHLDVHLGNIIAEFGFWSYVILFLVIFCETGLVITPFLPGDSLLFACGAFAATGSFNLALIFLILSLASICGDAANYWIGNYVGPKVFSEKKFRFLKKEHLERTHQFYEKHGGKTIIIARFIPIIRTFAPFVAGIGSMTYGKFAMFNIIGGTFWVGFFSVTGYFFGNLPFVKNNFSLVILAIILISVLPGIIQYLRHRTAKATNV